MLTHKKGVVKNYTFKVTKGCWEKIREMIFILDYMCRKSSVKTSKIKLIIMLFV